MVEVVLVAVIVPMVAVLQEVIQMAVSPLPYLQMEEALLEFPFCPLGL
jgi:hypothetical protein